MTKLWKAFAAAALLLLCIGGARIAHADTTNTGSAPTVQRTGFDHLTTGFELIGKHRDLPCESCHVNAIFKGTTHDCAACHGVGTQVRATAKPVMHILSSNRCEACHTPIAFSPAVNFDHAETRGSCSSCHDGRLAPGQGPTHVQTTLQCDACHSTIGWLGAGGAQPAGHIPNPPFQACSLCHLDANLAVNVVMSHEGITNGCAACHAAGRSFYKMAPPTLVQPPAWHVPFDGMPCESCHSNSTFTQPGGFAFTTGSQTSPPGMVHTAVSSIPCSTCHEVTSTFLSPSPTLKLRPATEPHSGNVPHPVSGECSDCHKSTSTFIGASNYPSNHIPLLAGTSAPCASCHTTSDYSQATMGANHNLVAATCTTCHASGKSFANMAPPKLVTSATTPAHVGFGTAECTSCHAPAKYDTFNFPNAPGASPGALGAMVHSAVTAIACSSCHGPGLAFKGSPSTVVKSATHIGIGSTVCTQCHAASKTAIGDFRNPSNAGIMVHTPGFTANCKGCHGFGLTDSGSPPTVTMPSSASPGLASHVPIGTGDCGTCHGPTNFTSFVMADDSSKTAAIGMVHSAVGSLACKSCHEKAYTWKFVTTPIVVRPLYLVPADPTSGAHDQTTDCGSCHFSTAMGGFALASTLPTNHIPLPAADANNCALCHTTPGVYTTAVMNHINITSGCAQCHAAGSSFTNMAPPTLVVTPATHVPFNSAPCESCHSNTNFTKPGGFAFTTGSTTSPAGMVHTAVSSIVCSTCHEAGKTYLSPTPAIKLRPAKKANGTAHVATGECSTCHFSTAMGGFKGATDLPANHIPLPAADANNCVMCHTTGVYTVAIMSHANITTNCAQCHAYGLAPFAGSPQPVAPPAGLTGHIPSNPPNGTAAIACEQCHSVTNFQTFAGTIMKHAAVRAMTCMSCHEIGMTWKVNTGKRLWVRDSANHHKGVDCGGSGCHNTQDKFALRLGATPGASQKAVASAASAGGGGAASLGRGGVFNHLRIAGSTCVSCHDGNNATGKPSGHIATSNSCESCHNTLAWLPVAQVDHLQVTGTCVSCHNKIVATGKGNNHIPSNDSCATCHTTNAWTPARFDHIGVASHTCKSCHDSLHAVGLPLNHVPTTAECDTCHGTLGWLPAKLDHTSLTARCSSCHNNNIAVGMAPTHMGTVRDCATCHSYPDWLAVNFTHTSATFPGAHQVSLTCVSCHTANTDQIPWPSAGNAGTCAGCHAKDFKPALHPKTAGGLSYTVGELQNCTGACHIYSDATLGTISKPLPGPYHRVTDAAFKH